MPTMRGSRPSPHCRQPARITSVSELAAEAMAQPRQLGPDLGVVENFAVEGDDQPVALHRLRAAGGEVDNGEARMHQRAMTVRPDVFAVGSAPAQVIARGTGAALDIAKTAKLNQSGNATHESTVLDFLSNPMREGEGPVKFLRENIGLPAWKAPRQMIIVDCVIVDLRRPMRAGAGTIGYAGAARKRENPGHPSRHRSGAGWRGSFLAKTSHGTAG